MGVALLAALGLTPVVKRIARWNGQVDWPSDDRWHDRPVALMGGVAIVGAVALGMAVAGTGAFPWPVWIGASALFALGLTDDLWGVRPEAKVLTQVLATAAVLYAGHEFWRGGPVWASIPLTFLWVIGITNALNLIDGIDGLAASVTAIAAGALALLSVALGNLALAAVMLALAGAAIGFLVYNIPPASVFMGDCGSLVLGYLLSVGALGVQGGGGPVVGTLVPIAVMAVPIFDTTFVTVTRVLRGRSVTDGGTDHVHHRLIKLGASEGQALALLSGMSAAFGGVALSALWMQRLLALAVAALLLVLVTVVGVYLATMGGGRLAGVSSSESGMTARFGALMRTYAGGASWKSVAGLLADLLVVGAAFVVAAYLRYGGAPPPDWSAVMLEILPAVIGAKLLVFYTFGLYEGIWRHAGTPEVVRLAGASGTASVIVWVGLVTVKGPAALAPSILILDWLVTTIGIGGARFAFRALRQYAAAHRDGGRRVLIYGSDPDGILLLRHLRQHPELGRTVVGLLDENSVRHGYRMQGVEVLGAPDDLPDICSDHDVEEVIVPLKAVSKEERSRIREQCAAAGVDCQYFDPTIRPAPETSTSPLTDNGRGEEKILSP
ncbi:probable glycosyltransferase [Salinibacter ruber DSM 13855]|uniref:Probable glycosyltransferase n=1 Tax=Salinibacter ruber (strain DSM 13855 / M31) TaxID=309807 RepID=Q2S4W9_SALRD|nr:probable glycosyltransferase [Salinibacter ruber DSM 13855]